MHEFPIDDSSFKAAGYGKPWTGTEKPHGALHPEIL
jgi:hypothetical protein